ncbi:MAG TPA: PH domain-containing protein [Steroidobacteraceae bacterium]|nr:PH domain-containing protein [Steroidobacteraceae bacterium]
MSYVDKTLAPGEQVVFRTRLSAIMFVWPVLIGLAGIVLLIFNLGDFVNDVALALLGIAVIFGLMRYFSFISSEFAVTNQRVIIKVGVLRRRTLELQRTKVEAIAVNQGLSGRIFGYGDIVVTGTGGTKEPFRQIGAPLQFSRAVQIASG